MTAADPVRCSFCDKDAHQVRELIAGPKVFICDECVEVAADMLRMRAEPSAELLGSVQRDGAPAWGGGGSTVTCALCAMPSLAADALLIPAKGALCRDCVNEVDARSADDAWLRRPRWPR